MRTIFAPFRRIGIRAGVAFAFGSMALSAFAAQLPARIAADANDSEFAVVKNSQQPLANPAFDAGRMPGDAQLSGITLHFSMSAAQQADLNALLVAQLDPSSPQFHQWLTPDQFGERFGMAQSDIEKVTQWLEQQGFTVDSVNRSHNAIRFSGTVAQVEAAFRTQMHYYQSNGERNFAPSGSLSVPAAFAGSVQTIRNLTSFRPHPLHVVPRAGFTSSFTSGQSGNTFFAPGDIATAYDIKPLTSGGNDGSGQSIAIVGQSAVSLSDLEAFQSAAGLTKKDPELVLMPGTGTSVTSNGDEGESDLDLEWSNAIAPGAHVVFVYTGSNKNYGVFDSTQYAIDQKLAQIISISYAACETELTASDLTTLEAMFQQAAAQGQTVMTASGDQGSTACAGFTNLTQAQQQAIAVNYPASSAYVTGVGGTEISTTNAKSSTYWNSTSGTDIVNSLKQYVPEIAWNDDQTPAPGGCSGSQCLSSSGGGTSTLVAQPSWQAGYFTATGATNPSSAHRLVPDVAFYSSPAYVGYLYCTSDKSSWGSTQTGSCTSGFREAGGLLTVAGGTSFASPVFAGMVAILNQKLNYSGGQGMVNPTLYKLAANASTYSSAFHAVTSGNNNCNSGSTICGSSVGVGFSAHAGYNQVTGLGSLDLAAIANVWPVNTGASAAQLSTSTAVAAGNSSPAAGANVTFTVTVTTISGTSVPTGTVTLQIDGGTKFGGTTVTNQALSATGTVTYTTAFAAAGPHQVLAQYSGDTTHAASVGTAEIIVPTGGTGTPAVGVKATNVSVVRGSSADSTITVTPAGGYTGQVLLSLSTTNSALTNLCYSFPSTDNNGNGIVNVSGTAAATTTLTLDTKASDCVSGKAVGAGMQRIKIVGASSASNNKPGAPSKGVPMGLAFAGLLLAGGLAKASRKLRSLACVIALAAFGFGLTACSSSTVTNNNPPKGTYTMQLTGQDSKNATITSQTSFTLTIN